MEIGGWNQIHNDYTNLRKFKLPESQFHRSVQLEIKNTQPPVTHKLRWSHLSLSLLQKWMAYITVRTKGGLSQNLFESRATRVIIGCLLLLSWRVKLSKSRIWLLSNFKFLSESSQQSWIWLSNESSWSLKVESSQTRLDSPLAKKNPDPQSVTSVQLFSVFKTPCQKINNEFGKCFFLCYSCSKNPCWKPVIIQI